MKKKTCDWWYDRWHRPYCYITSCESSSVTKQVVCPTCKRPVVDITAKVWNEVRIMAKERRDCA